MNNNKEKTAPPSSAQLSGFAPAAGTGAAGSLAAPPATASASKGAAAAAAVAASAAGGGAGTAAKKPAASSAAQTKRTKKRGPKKGGTPASSAATSESNDNSTEETVLRPLSEVGSTTFEPLSLPQIQLRLKKLLDKIPTTMLVIPSDYDIKDSAEYNSERHAPIKTFACALQITIEEYNLILSLVSSATYKWGVDRSGASQQNLSVMSAELLQAQDVISNVVSPRLSNVLCPAVDLMVGEIEIVREGQGGKSKDDDEGGDSAAANQRAKKRKLNEDRLSTASSSNERRINHFTRPLVDPSYVHLCHCILARNAPLIRHTVATSIHTAQRVIGDYLNAMKKDSGHEDSKGGYY